MTQEIDNRENPEAMFANPISKEFFHAIIEGMFRDTHPDECYNPCNPAAGNPETTTVEGNLHSGTASLIQSMPHYRDQGVIISGTGEVLTDTALPIYMVGPLFFAALPNYSIAFVKPLREMRGGIRGFKVLGNIPSWTDRPSVNQPKPRFRKADLKVNPTLELIRDKFMEIYLADDSELGYSMQKGLTHPTTKWKVGDVLSDNEQEEDTNFDEAEADIDVTDIGDLP